MTRIDLATWIEAPRERVFDLARSVEAHLESAEQSGEQAIGGVTSGLLGLGDEVTFRGRHLGLRWTLTSRIAAFDRPAHFRDSMVRGPFARMAHDHWFETSNEATLMRDRLDYALPLGILGRAADRLIVERHLRRFLEIRAAALRRLAESSAARQ